MKTTETEGVIRVISDIKPKRAHVAVWQCYLITEPNGKGIPFRVNSDSAYAEKMWFYDGMRATVKLQTSYGKVKLVSIKNSSPVCVECMERATEGDKCARHYYRCPL